MKERLDQKDALLVTALRQNARASLVALARDIGLSRSATHDRVLKLEEKGIIRRYTIDVDRSVMPSHRAFLSIQFKNDETQKALAEFINELDGVQGAFCLSGDIDMLVYCECETSEELASLRDQVSGLTGIIEVRTRNVLASSQS